MGHQKAERAGGRDPLLSRYLLRPAPLRAGRVSVYELLGFCVGGSVWPRGTVTSPPRPPLGPMVVYSPDRGAGAPGGKLLILFMF